MLIGVGGNWRFPPPPSCRQQQKKKWINKCCDRTTYDRAYLLWWEFSLLIGWLHRQERNKRKENEGDAKRRHRFSLLVFSYYICNGLIRTHTFTSCFVNHVKRRRILENNRALLYLFSREKRNQIIIIYKRQFAVVLFFSCVCGWFKPHRQPEVLRAVYHLDDICFRLFLFVLTTLVIILLQQQHKRERPIVYVSLL